MLKILKSAYNFFDSVSSEVSYWKQIQNLESELEQTGNALSVTSENEEYLRRDNLKLIAENKALKDDIQDSKAAYQSLLFDYFEAAKKHRQYKQQSLEELREALAKIEKLEERLYAVKF